MDRRARRCAGSRRVRPVPWRRGIGTVRARRAPAFTKGADGEQTRIMTTKTPIARQRVPSAEGRPPSPRAWPSPCAPWAEGTLGPARGADCARGLRGRDVCWPDGMTSARSSRSCVRVALERSQVIFQPRRARTAGVRQAMAESAATARNQGSGAGTIENQDMGSPMEANNAHVRRCAEVAVRFRVARDRRPVETLGLYALTEAKWRRVACLS
jgi:hypothetical protein